MPTIGVCSADNGSSDGRTVRIRHCLQFPSLDCVVDRILAMRDMENKSYHYLHYCGRPCKADTPPIVLVSTWREQVCEWAYNVMDHFKLSRETVAVCMSLLDRFLAVKSQQSHIREDELSSSFVLLSTMACLQLAVKINEPRRFRLEQFCHLSNGHFSPHQVEESECNILSTLDWKVNPPTALEFVGLILLLLPLESEWGGVIGEVYQAARFIIELSICDEYFVPVDASRVAMASIIIATEDVPATSDLLSTQTKVQFLKTISELIHMHSNDPQIKAACLKLKNIYWDNVVSWKNEVEEEHIIIARDSPTSVVDGAIKEIGNGAKDLLRSVQQDHVPRPNKRRSIYTEQ